MDLTTLLGIFEFSWWRILISLFLLIFFYFISIKFIKKSEPTIKSIIFKILMYVALAYIVMSIIYLFSGFDFYGGISE